MAAVSAPAVAIGLLGLAHPVFLTPDTADRWQVVHLLLLPAFPLLGMSFAYLLRLDRGAIGWAGRLAAFAYAVLYGALDAIAGVGAPEQTRNAADAPIGDLYAIGDRLGHLGVVALAVAAVLAGVSLWRRARSPLAPAGVALVLAAAPFFYRHHVFPPRGVLAMLTIAAGLALLAAAEREPA